MGRNWEYSKQQGRKMRLNAEMQAFKHDVPVSSVPPLFSHDATMQSYFEKAWTRVSQNEINRHLGLAKTPEGNDLVSKIRSFRECHFHSSRG